MLSHLSTTASKHDVATDLINHHQIGRGMTMKNEGIIILRTIFWQRSSQITGSSSKHGRAAAAAPQSVYSTVCAVAAIFCSRRAGPISPEDCRRSFEGNGSSPPSADNSKLGRVGPWADILDSLPAHTWSWKCKIIRFTCMLQQFEVFKSVDV